MSEPQSVRAVLVAAGLLSETGDVPGADASHPDAALMGLLRERAQEQRIEDALRQTAEDSSECDTPSFRSYVRVCEIYDDLARTPAHTREAAMARALVVVEAISREPEETCHPLLRLAATVIRDALAGDI